MELVGLGGELDDGAAGGDDGPLPGGEPTNLVDCFGGILADDETGDNFFQPAGLIALAHFVLSTILIRSSSRIVYT